MTLDRFAERLKNRLNLMEQLDDALYISLHSSDPHDMQGANEVHDPGYRRARLPRDAAHWNVEAGIASNAKQVGFHFAKRGYTHVISHVGIGTKASGPGAVLFSIELAQPMFATWGMTLDLPAGLLQVSVEALMACAAKQAGAECVGDIDAEEAAASLESALYRLDRHRH